MATDETLSADAAPATQASEKPGEKTDPRLPTVRAGAMNYVVQHRLLHDGAEYKAGDRFESGDAKVIAALRKAGAIALLTEVMAADEVAAQMAAREAEVAQLRAELERMQQAAAVAASGGKSGGK